MLLAGSIRRSPASAGSRGHAQEVWQGTDATVTSTGRQQRHLDEDQRLVRHARMEEREIAAVAVEPVFEIGPVAHRAGLDADGLLTDEAAERGLAISQRLLGTALGSVLLRLAPGPARAAGAIPLAIHPILHFTGTSLDVQRLKDAYFAVTAPATVMPIAQALVVEMGGEPIVINEADRPAFAEVVDTVATFSRAIIDQSTFRLTEIGVERPGEVLRALAHSAVDESLRRSADGAVDPVEAWLDDSLEDDD